MKKTLIAVLALSLLASSAFAKKKKGELVRSETGGCYMAEFFAGGRSMTGFVLKSPNYPRLYRIKANGRVYEVGENFISRTWESDSCPDL